MSEPKRISELNELNLGTTYAGIPSGIYFPAIKSGEGGYSNKKIDLNTLATLIYEAAKIYAKEYTDEKVAGLSPSSGGEQGSSEVTAAEFQELSEQVSALRNQVTTNQSVIGNLLNPTSYPTHQITLVDASDPNQSVTYTLPCGPGTANATLKIPTTTMPSIKYVITLGWTDPGITVDGKNITAKVAVGIDKTSEYTGGTLESVSVKLEYYYSTDTNGTNSSVVSIDNFVLSSESQNISSSITLSGDATATLPVNPGYCRVVAQLIVGGKNQGIVSSAEWASNQSTTGTRNSQVTIFES